MVKLPVLSRRKVCTILSKHGFTEIRQRGSHIVMQRQTAGDTITVVVPDHTELARGTLASIIRQSGLSRDEFTA